MNEPTIGLAYGFRRRCSWCGVVLRGWQLNLCRRCKKAVRWDAPSPWCSHGSRWEAWPDELPWRGGA